MTTSSNLKLSLISEQLHSPVLPPTSPLLVSLLSLTSICWKDTGLHLAPLLYLCSSLKYSNLHPWLIYHIYTDDTKNLHTLPWARLPELQTCVPNCHHDMFKRCLMLKLTQPNEKFEFYLISSHISNLNYRTAIFPA